MTHTSPSNSRTGLWILISVIVIIGVILILASNGNEEPPTAAVDIFAQCLTEKGAVMYGAFWCPHCARTKERFGSSFKYINYIECDPRGENEQSELCIQKGIQGYDTWEFADGSRYVSEPTFELLSERTGCALP